MTRDQALEALDLLRRELAGADKRLAKALRTNRGLQNKLKKARRSRDKWMKAAIACGAMRRIRGGK